MKKWAISHKDASISCSSITTEAETVQSTACEAWKAIPQLDQSSRETAVFDEQERHWDADETDKIQAISAAYRRTTSSCQMWAHVVGNRDQQAVEAYLYDDDEDKEEMTVAPRVMISQKPPAVKSPKLGKATRAVVVLARAA